MTHSDTAPIGLSLSGADDAPKSGPAESSKLRAAPNATRSTGACVVCMKWGDVFAPEYVNVLKRAVARHLDRAHRFLCFTDNPSGILPDVEIRPLPYTALSEARRRHGGWLKLSVFRDGLFEETGPVLFLDLDVAIVGSLDPFFDDQPHGELRIIRDWRPWPQSIYRRPGTVGNSSVFRFQANGQPHIFKRFTDDPEAAFATFRNEQRFLTHHASGLDYWPDEWCRSFKRHCMGSPLLRGFRQPEIPSGARVVVFHGTPKPIDLLRGSHRVEWVDEYWQRYQQD